MATPTIEHDRYEAGTLTEARLIEMVFPEQTNHYGTLFGRGIDRRAPTSDR